MGDMLLMLMRDSLLCRNLFLKLSIHFDYMHQGFTMNPYIKADSLRLT